MKRELTQEEINYLHHLINELGAEGYVICYDKQQLEIINAISKIIFNKI